MYVFFTKQTIVKSIKVLVPFQDAEETCKICKTDFSDERNKITLGERVVGEGGVGGGGGVSELTMLVSSEGKTYKPKREIMSMLTVDVSTPTRVSLLLN